MFTTHMAAFVDFAGRTAKIYSFVMNPPHDSKSPDEHPPPCFFISLDRYFVEKVYAYCGPIMEKYTHHSILNTFNPLCMGGRSAWNTFLHFSGHKHSARTWCIRVRESHPSQLPWWMSHFWIALPALLLTQTVAFLRGSSSYASKWKESNACSQLGS